MFNFEFSDTISGTVGGYQEDKGEFGLTTSDGRKFNVKLSANVSAQVVRNLGEPYLAAGARLKSHLEDGQMLMVYGTFYPDSDGARFEAQNIYIPGKTNGKYRFEEANWWVNQMESIGDFFIKAQFGGPDTINFRNYRTTIDLTGKHTGNQRQETDTISRMIFGMASIYMLTGEDRFLEVAEKGTQYLRDHMQFYDTDENIIYWYHGIDVNKDGSEHKVFSSEFGDDYDAIPMYEQIYALAGPTQTMKANGDPKIMKDIELTMELFERFFKDPVKNGYYSHLDAIGMSAKDDTLGRNMGAKNWNSVGDHAPAYLINLYLATGEKKYADMLEYCADQICKYFPDYDNSPFVQERFHDDWSHESEWGWQQDRAVVGHNLKIAWNLMRINSIVPKDTYVKLAEKIADLMPKVGMDKQRFGWYDVMERKIKKGESEYRFAWHDRKAWWQQEQGILAYQILYGILKKPEYLKYARESAAFYNAFFLDHDDGSVYFNTLCNGIPFLVGNERFKGSHSMSAYHSVELCFLSQIYINFLHTGKPLDLYFKPVENGFKNNIIRVEPDILPKNSVTIGEVWINGEPWKDFDAEKLTVRYPSSDERPKIKVRLVPVKK
ncbi:MAG: AGE family epimerase/isomerase [Candidatus Riflebacteria bacterium]|nr:AGE family epimerase/isomerase [Candidatus Riflebacteria bacterium]